MATGPSPYVASTDRPIFIGACPRSGTTLLRTMLNTHPDIAIPRETRFLPDIWDNRAQFRNLDDKAVRRRLARTVTAKGNRSVRFQTPRPALIRRLVAAPPTLGSVVGTGYVAYAEATGKKRWGDKRPMYSRYLDAIFAMFPDSQFINVIRDPRASVASMRKLGWFGGNIVPGLELWERSLRAVEPWRQVLHDDQFLDIRYEDLVTDPVELLTRTSAFLGLSPDSIPTMLNYHQHVDETAVRYHARLSEPVSTTSVRAWEVGLTPDEVALVEDITGSWLDRFGYERVSGGDRPSAALLAAYDTRRRQVRRERRRVELDEFKRLFVYREPVAARLTTGQRQISAPVAMPPFRQRHLGKPS
jgi:Sulfotransferase family